jgi:hypothetical protein
MSDEPTDVVEGGGITYRRRYDWEEVEPSVAVVDALIEVTDERAKNVGPLAEYLDPDSLDGLLHDTEPTPAPVKIEFQYDGYHVVAHRDGRLLVRALE